MLVLSRHLDEEIVIRTATETIVLQIVHIDRCKVRIGFTAPKHVTIHRREIDDLAQAADVGGEG